MQGPEAESQRFLEAIRAGDRDAASRLLWLLHDELKQVASRKLAKGRAANVLNPAGLVRGAYLKLAADTRKDWRDRARFMAVAGDAARRVVREFSTRFGAGPGSGGQTLQVKVPAPIGPGRATTVDASGFERTMARLEALDARQGALAQHCLFGGLSARESGGALDVEAIDAAHLWAFTQAWLSRAWTEEDTSSVERHAQLTAAFLRVFPVDAAARSEALAQLGADDPDLVSEVRALLAHHDEPAAESTSPSGEESAPDPPEPGTDGDATGERVLRPALLQTTAEGTTAEGTGTEGTDTSPAQIGASIGTPAKTADPKARDEAPTRSVPTTATRSKLHPGRRARFWPLTAAAALVVAVAGWTIPLVAPSGGDPHRAALSSTPSRETDAELVNAFLTEALRVPDPIAIGPQATMTAWLDRMGKELESRFGGRPLVKASIHRLIGRSYRELRLPKRAGRHFQATLELRTRALGHTHRTTLEAAALTGLALLEEGRHLDEAEQSLGDVLRTRLAELGPEDADTLASRVHLARLHAKRGEVEEAERVFDDTLKSMHRILGPDHPVTLEAKERYALFLLGLNRTAEAAPRASEVHGRYRDRYGANHPRTVAMLHALATTHSRSGDDAKAEAAFAELLRVHLALHGKEHQKTLFARLNLGIVLEKRKQYAAAENQFRQAVEVHRRTAALDPPVLVTAATRWARVLTRLGRLDQAAAEFARIDALVARLYRPGDPRLHRFRAERGELLTTLGRYPDAERVLLNNYRWLEKRPGDDMPRRDDYLAPLLRLYGKWDKVREARRIQAEIDRRKKSGG